MIKAGSRAIATKDGNTGCEVLAVHGNKAWVLFDGEDWPVTYYRADLEMVMEKAT